MYIFIIFNYVKVTVFACGYKSRCPKKPEVHVGSQELESQITVSYLVWVLGTKLLFSEKVVSALDY